MIKSFKDKDTEKIFNQEYSRKFPEEIQYRALKKFIMLNNAESENDIIVPNSNHFEHLKGDRKGECSIIINDKWRICFKFNNGNAYNVSIEDYH